MSAKMPASRSLVSIPRSCSMSAWASSWSPSCLWESRTAVRRSAVSKKTKILIYACSGYAIFLVAFVVTLAFRVP